MSMQSEHINELALALAKAQAEMKPAVFDKVNPHYKNKYASLASFIDACKTPLNKHQLSFIQTTMLHEKGTILVTKLLHSSGQWVSGELLIIQDKPGIQAFGSQLTYSKRYALSSMLGIASDDDDDGELDRNATAKAKQEAAVTKLTSEQTKVLRGLLNQCDDAYKAWFANHMSNTYGTMNLADLPSDIFGKIRESVKKNAEKNQSKTNKGVEEHFLLAEAQ